MSDRIYNFNAGPGTLPLEVLQKAQSELLNYKNSGMSVMEISHRSKDYEEINDAAISLFKELMGLDDSYKVMFMGGGASSQFAIIPMNFLNSDKTAVYIDTGEWSGRAIKEAKKFGTVNLAGLSGDKNYNAIPAIDSLNIPDSAEYLHLTSNNTIFGTQWQSFPKTDLPLFCDMSSDILSRQLDYSKFDLIYAGSQKNLGPAGVTVIIAKMSLLKNCNSDLPVIFDYNTHASKNSLYNTPPVFSIYMVKLVLEWINDRGGLKTIEKENAAKKDCIYSLMDEHPDFYRGTAQKDSRSWMNITMRLPSEDLESRFVAEATASGFGGLKGHRSVGGIRVSLYNAMPLEGAEKLAEFMLEFKKAN